MRIVLVGRALDRARARRELDVSAMTVVAEADSLPAARDDAEDVDAYLVLATPPTATVEERAAPPAVEHLTPRELEVLRWLAEGLPNKAIAVRLGISDQTVKFHVASITGKLGVSNRTEAVRRAYRRGLLTL